MTEDDPLRELEEILQSPNRHDAIKRILKSEARGPVSFERALPFLSNSQIVDMLEAIFEYGLEENEPADRDWAIRRATELGLTTLAQRFRDSLPK